MDFPSGFMWGVSTAGYQVEGGDTASNWAAWDRAGKTKEVAGRAIDQWNRYGEDLDLAKGMGLSSLRLSIEWSRIEPRRGEIDPAAVQHYHDVLAACHARNVEPVVTISHFTYPAWLDKGNVSAWETPEMPKELARFAGFVAHEYGKEVKWWLTINEPNTLAICGYLAGMHAPGKHNPFLYQQVLDRQVEAHKLMYDAIHAEDPDAMVSINPIVIMRRPDNPVYKVKAAGLLDGFGSPDEQTFLDRVSPPWIDGKAPDPMAGKRRLDYLALNYFYASGTLDVYKLMDYQNWPIYPQGLYHCVRRMHQRHRLPVMITENGMPTTVGVERADKWTREAYIVNHVAQLHRAVREGVPVLGYMHWTLVDNYEWGTYQPRFGLFTVDFKDPELKRVRTPAADIYERIAKTNGVPGALADRYVGFKN
jgi:beta-glucosidase